MKRVCVVCGESYEFPFLMETASYAPAVCEPCVDKRLAEAQAALPPELPNAVHEDYEKMGIMPEHYGATIDNWFSRSDYDEKAIRRSCLAMLSARRGILVMLGNNGTGKTHLAAAMLKELGGKYFRMGRLMKYIQAGYKDGNQESEYETLVRLGKIPLLVIDEVEKSSGSGFEGNTVSDIIDDRYARGKPTILISNLHPAKTCQKNGCSRCFESIMSPDVLDRIMQVGVTLHFTGESYRKGLRGK